MKLPRDVEAKVEALSAHAAGARLPDAAPGKWTLTVPGWQPARLNELLGDWRRAAKRKKVDRETVAFEARRQGIPEARGKRRVRLTVVMGPRQRCPDVDAFFKSLLDGLVACGLLRDDNKENCELAPVVYERGKARATVITLEDIA